MREPSAADRHAAGTAAAVCAAAIAAAAFLPTLAFGFVYDDHRFIEGNHNLASPSILGRAFTDPSCQTADGTDAGLWRPLRTLSFAFDRAVFRGAAWGPHLVNLLLHGAATAMVFLLLRRIGASARAAFLAALVYALHPVQVECVAWISSRGDLLAIALTLAAIVLSLDGRSWLALAAGAAALLAKGEQAAVWPALVFLAHLLAKRPVIDGLQRACAAGAVVLVSVAARHAAGAEFTQQGGLGLGAASATQIAGMLAHQAAHCVLPVGTAFDWQMPPGVCPLAAKVVTVAAFAALVWRPVRIPALWFLAALVPTLFLQMIVPLNISVADRFLLFALPALAIVVARCADFGGTAPAVLAVLCLGGLSQAAMPAWRSDLTLWSGVAAANPGHPRANHWLGKEALDRQDWTAAAERLSIAAQASPFDAETRYRLGCALDGQARLRRDPAMLMRAHQEFEDAILLFGGARAEGRDEMLPLARVASADAALRGGTDAFGVERLRLLLEGPAPSVPGRVRAQFAVRIESLAAAAAAHPSLGPSWADRVRTWGRLP